MGNNDFSWASLFSDREFQSREIDTEELETIVRDAVEREHKGDPVKELKYNDEGIEIILESGQVIGIDVDWHEIVLT